MSDAMETLSEATRRLEADGFDAQFLAVDDHSDTGSLRCPVCGRHFVPERATVHEQVRFEGTSDPDDEAILLAITCPCGERGLYTAMFGPEMSPEDVAVVHNLPRH